MEFDPFSHACLEDPYPAYRFMLEQAPVYQSERHGFWALSRFEDVQRAARDWETFSSTGGVDLSGSVGLLGEGGFLGMDPPRHDVLRLSSAPISPRKASRPWRRASRITWTRSPTPSWTGANATSRSSSRDRFPSG